MEVAAVAALIIIAAVFLLALGKKSAEKQELPYRSLKYLLSKAERSFYGALTQAAGEDYVVFTKVRAADVIAPKRGLQRSEWQSAFNMISKKHFDFVICHPKDCSVQAVLELDDSSHGSAKAKRKDDFLNGACQSAGIPMIRIKASKGYVVGDIRRDLKGAIERGNSQGEAVPDGEGLMEPR